MTTRNYTVQSDAGQRDQSETSELAKALGGNNRAIVLAYLFGNKEPILDYPAIARSTDLSMEEVNRIIDKELKRGTIVNRNGLILNPGHSLTSRIKELEIEIFERSKPAEVKYRERFEGYTLDISWLDPNLNEAEVELITKGNKHYFATFITKEHADKIFSAGTVTGEGAHGTFLDLSIDTIVIKNLEEASIRKTIEYLIANCRVDERFTTYD